MTIKIFLSMAAYFSFLVLFMPVSVKGVLSVALLFIAGRIFIIWKKPQNQINNISLVSIIISAAMLFNFGPKFYSRWIQSSKLAAIANILRIPADGLLKTVTVFIVFIGCMFLAVVLQQIFKFFRSQKSSFVRNLLAGLSSAVITIVLSQTMNDMYMLSMGYEKFFWGTMVVFVLIMTVYCITDAIRFSIALVTGFFMVISTVNVYVYLFRLRQFLPVDFFSIRTAVNVADNYNLFPVPRQVVSSWKMWGIMLVFLFVICSGAKYAFSLKRKRVLVSLCMVSLISVFSYAVNLPTYNWYKDGAILNGYILDFTSRMKDLYIPKPEGYSLDLISDIAEKHQYVEEQIDISEKKPHIIVIMNEAFSDLNVVREVETDKEVMPFISSLKDNVISGYAMASVYGGNTSNSEFEMLTGNSMAWLSADSVPYSQYIREPSYSIVSYLEQKYNYHTLALHPYYSNCWNRLKVYEYYGFDESFFISSFPQKHLIRQYVSDMEMFDMIIDKYENRRRDNPLFVFGVTMQNHGGYAYSGVNYTQHITLTGDESVYPEVEQYLSLIHETDKAVEYLINYFNNAEEDVVIVMFGDHQPKIDENFYGTLSENENLLEYQQKKYKIPFFIWSNYDIDEKYVECTSLNYLSSYIYKAAGMDLPVFNRFLSDMEQKIPSINAQGFYSADQQKFLSFDMATDEEKDLLNLYENLQYNNLFDTKNRNKILFPTIE